MPLLVMPSFTAMALMVVGAVMAMGVVFVYLVLPSPFLAGVLLSVVYQISAPFVAVARVTGVPLATAPAAGVAVGVATVLLPLNGSSGSSHPAKVNPITAASAITPNSFTIVLIKVSLVYNFLKRNLPYKNEKKADFWLILIKLLATIY
jgi:hypothetical protein